MDVILAKMTENEILQKVKEYIDETDCSIKDPSQLLRECAMSAKAVGIDYPNYKILSDFNAWYVDNIIRVENGTMRDEEMYGKIQEYIDETNCIIKDPKQLLKEFLNNCRFYRSTRYEGLAKEFEVWYKKNIQPYR